MRKSPGEGLSVPLPDFFATAAHYVDHLQPVVEELGTSFTEVPTSDTVVVASIADVQTAREFFGWKHVIHAAHGIGQTYEGRSTGLRARATRTVGELFLAPNDRLASEIQSMNPFIEVEVIGVPRMDAIAALPRPTTRTVAISFRWRCRHTPEATTTFDFYREQLYWLRESLPDVEILGHGHPNLWHEIEPVWRAAGIEPVRSFNEVLRRAQVYVCDNSSSLFEFAAVGPVVVLNAPHYRRDVDHGGRFWEWADVGEQVDEPACLAEAITRAFDDPRTTRRREVVSQVLPHVGQAAQRAADAIRRYMAHTPEERERLMSEKTVRVRLLHPRAGLDDTMPTGTELEVSADKAKRMFEDGAAEAVATTRAATAEKRPATPAPQTRAPAKPSPAKKPAAKKTPAKKPATRKAPARKPSTKK